MRKNKRLSRSQLIQDISWTSTLQHGEKEFSDFGKTSSKRMVVRVMFRNKVIINIYTVLLENSDKIVVHVETSARMINKYGLPYRKSAVLNSEFLKENRYSKQLDLGVGKVMEILNYIREQYFIHYGVKISGIVSERSTGACSNSGGKVKKVSINFR